MTVALRVVYRNSNTADGHNVTVVEFRRADTNKRVSCVECESFTDEGKCGKEISHPWPLGSICCTEWALRTVLHAMKNCVGCGAPMPKYLHNQDHCSELCRRLHERRVMP